MKKEGAASGSATEICQLYGYKNRGTERRYKEVLKALRD